MLYIHRNCIDFSYWRRLAASGCCFGATVASLSAVTWPIQKKTTSVQVTHLGKTTEKGVFSKYWPAWTQYKRSASVILPKMGADITRLDLTPHFHSITSLRRLLRMFRTESVSKHLRRLVVFQKPHSSRPLFWPTTIVEVAPQNENLSNSPSNECIV